MNRFTWFLWPEEEVNWMSLVIQSQMTARKYILNYLKKRTDTLIVRTTSLCHYLSVENGHFLVEHNFFLITKLDIMVKTSLDSIIFFYLMDSKSIRQQIAIERYPCASYMIVVLSRQLLRDTPAPAIFCCLTSVIDFHRHPSFELL